MGEETQQVRELKHRNRQLSKTCGKQGQSIYQLRAELAEVRELVTKRERGELRRLERVTQEMIETIYALEEKLAAAQQRPKKQGPPIEQFFPASVEADA